MHVPVGTESPRDLASTSHDQKSHDHCQRLVVRLLKDVGKGLGINIVDLKESSGDTSAESTSKIVIESVVKGGPADVDGKLRRGESPLSHTLSPPSPRRKLSD